MQFNKLKQLQALCLFVLYNKPLLGFFWKKIEKLSKFKLGSSKDFDV